MEGRRGNFETETDQIASLYDRMEYCLGKTHAGKLPDSIVADLLGREMKDWREGREGDPGHTAQRGEQDGLGSVDESRREAGRAVALEAIMKLHKTPVRVDQ